MPPMLDLAAQVAADPVELLVSPISRPARPGEGDADVLDDAAWPLAHHQNAIAQEHRLADRMGDEQGGAVMLLQIFISTRFISSRVIASSALNGSSISSRSGW
jgi:hypothetical protein